ncbi:MAG: cytochrome B6 [Chloroflexi bacterium HGW-Chloroflexi-2]|jgi:quinol-cytochrome oxidoreductase complex cytochrome b subunit|nr:MAG: cytochrome B6 [Chloroflexi bacterium HGW-Chloroflexi-2]
MSLEFIKPLRDRLLPKETAAQELPSRDSHVRNNLILHLHPSRVPAQALRFTYTWGLGGISVVLVLLLGLTGLLLMFRYDPRVEYAYVSIQQLETEVMFGSFVRAVHHWSANFLVIASFLHLVRVFLTGSFKQGRSVNWIIGLVLFVIVLAGNFTGYLLPWDQLSYWAITVSTSLMAYIPLLGTAVRNFFLGGPQVGQAALSNFYALHVVFMPALLLGFLAYHLWKVRKNGGISQPLLKEDEKPEFKATNPHLVNIELAAGLVVVVVVGLYAMLNPAPLGSIANPMVSPNPAKAAWYFLGLQELLLHMHPLAVMSLLAVAVIALAIIPWIDRDFRDIGIYFRSAIGRRAAVFGSLLAVYLVPLAVILDEFWYDVPGWLPGVHTNITVGVIPFLITISVFVGIYFLLKSGLLFKNEKTNHSEAMLGVFAFMMTGLILLTIVGIYFRGQNMALVLPF